MKYFIFFILLFPSVFSHSQNLQKDSFPILNDALHAEILGLARISFVYDLAIHSRHRVLFGVGVVGLEQVESQDIHEAHSVFAPSLSYSYLFGNSRSFFELGLGAHLGLSKRAFYESPFGLYGLIGWRRQIKDKVIWRVGFSPMFQPTTKYYEHNGVLWPLFTLSVGFPI